ncbi:MAG: alpha/beta fold hydrolase [Steroidobacteraceae bacterium]
MSLPNGMRLAYLEWGNPRGRPVVLIHGYTDNARDWVPLLPFLSPAYRLILIDIRGHGASSKPECCYDRLEFAYDVKLLLDAHQAGGHRRAFAQRHHHPDIGGVLARTGAARGVDFLLGQQAQVPPAIINNSDCHRRS